ncbi:MAG: ABC transporter substrate-binding protein [Acidimicrobiia bacterium]|nr:ABC transporter substrate-binding protein [Acidimicrobiia bacterium]
MKKRRLLRLVALLMVFGLVAAACGSDDDGDDGSVAAEEEAPEEEAAEGEAAPEEEAAEEEAPEEEAAGEEAPEEEMATEYDLGGGAILDISECPDDWDNSAGVSDDEIRIGITVPRSGPLAGFGTIADGVQIYFDNYGPVDGKSVTIVDRDDGYEAARTLTGVEEIIDTEDVLGFSFIIGSPNNAAVRDLLNEECIPHLWASTGLPDWGDPVNFPWTSGLLTPYTTEADIWCEHIVQEFGEGATVAGLFMNNDFGKAYQAQVEACTAENGLDLVENVVHDPAAESVANEITTLAASDADVAILGTTGAFCPQGVAGVAGSPWEPMVLVSATCQNIGLFWDPIGPLAEGFRILGTVKDVSDPTYADDAFVLEARAAIEAAGFDPAEGSYSTGYQFGRTLQETFDVALALGGIDRVNLARAAYGLDFESEASLPGITSITDGSNDSYIAEGAFIVSFDAENRRYVEVSDVISFEGETGTFGIG